MYTKPSQARDDVEGRECRGTSAQIRDLLVPVADFYRAGYEERQANRRVRANAEVRRLLSSPKRQNAYMLADGTRTQRELSRESGLDEGSTSKLFKRLRELGAIEGANPTHTMQVDL